MHRFTARGPGREPGRRDIWQHGASWFREDLGWRAGWPGRSRSWLLPRALCGHPQQRQILPRVTVSQKSVFSCEASGLGHILNPLQAKQKSIWGPHYPGPLPKDGPDPRGWKGAPDLVTVLPFEGAFLKWLPHFAGLCVFGRLLQMSRDLVDKQRNTSRGVYCPSMNSGNRRWASAFPDWTLSWQWPSFVLPGTFLRLPAK